MVLIVIIYGRFSSFLICCKKFSWTVSNSSFLIYRGFTVAYQSSQTVVFIQWCTLQNYKKIKKTFRKKNNILFMSSHFYIQYLLATTYCERFWNVPSLLPFIIDELLHYKFWNYMLIFKKFNNQPHIVNYL